MKKPIARKENTQRKVPRRDKAPHTVQPRQHDTYRDRKKPPGAQVCTECGLVNHTGRWYRGAPPATTLDPTLCPACQRIRDDYPGGTIHVGGQVARHREEIVRMMRNEEQAEVLEHPLERLMAIVDVEDGLRVTTTGVHLARRIANKLERRFHEQAQLRYVDEQNMLFVELGGEA